MMMNDATLRKIDLNLLLAFSVLMQERNVSRAAERLLLGQPGLSAALRRLRETLDDELFVRVGRGLQPTPRALSIAPAIEDALSGIERAIRPQADFDPASWQGEFRIGMCDNLESAFFGPLAARLLQLSPGARLIGVEVARAYLSASSSAIPTDLDEQADYWESDWHRVPDPTKKAQWLANAKKLNKLLGWP